MYNFDFSMQTKIYFGRDREQEVGERLKEYGHNVLLVYGSQRLFQDGLGDRLTKSIKKAGLKVTLFGGVVPNPRLSHIEEGIAICKREKIDVILAVGGGSVMDSAKAIALGSCCRANLWDALCGKVPGEQMDKALPIGGVVTMPASASEANGLMVITRDESGEKKMGFFEAVRPKFAILNPELTFSLPKNQTAIGSFDAFSHAFERYFDLTRESELFDRVTASLMKTIIRQLPIALEQPKHYQARAELMLSATAAHSDMLGPGGDFGCHEISHTLTARYGIAHGAALAMILPAWAEYMAEKRPERFAQFASQVWGTKEQDRKDMAFEGIRSMKQFIRNIGLELTYEIPKADLEILAEGTAGSSGFVGGNFQKLKKEDLTAIYERMRKKPGKEGNPISDEPAH